jgi:hypothetical protein
MAIGWRVFGMLYDSQFTSSAEFQDAERNRVAESRPCANRGAALGQSTTVSAS